MTPVEKNNLLTASIITLTTFAACAATFVFLWINKPVNINAQSEIEEVVSGNDDYALSVRNDDSVCGLCFELPHNSASTVSYYYDYLGNRLRIVFKSGDTGFYKTHDILCAPDIVRSGQCIVQDEYTYLFFDIDGIWCAECNIAGNTINILLIKPEDKYDFICVLDAEYPEGYTEELRLLAEDTQRRLEENGIGVFLTTKKGMSCPYSTGEEPTLRAVILTNLAEATGADLILSLGVEKTEEEIFGFRAYYSEQFYNNRLSNATLSKTVINTLAEEMENRALSIEKASECAEAGYLYDLTIPAARITLGNMNNEKEEKLLKNERYLENMACSLAEAVKRVYEEDYIRNQK